MNKFSSAIFKNRILSGQSVKNYLSVLLGIGSARIIALFNNVLIARFLGAEKYGQFSLFYVIMLFAWIVPQSLDTTFVKFAKGQTTSGAMSNYWRANVQLKVIFCLSIILISYPTGHLLADVFFQKPQTAWLISYGLVCGALLSIMNSVASYFQVREKFGFFAVMQGLYTATVCIGLLILFWITSIRNIAFVVYLYTAISGMIGAASLAMLLGTIPNFSIIEPGIIRNIIQFGKWIFLTAIVFYAFPRIDGMVLTRYLSIEALGHYSVASQLTMAITVVTGSLSAVFLPKAMSVSLERGSLASYIKDAVRPVSLILVCIVLLEFFAPLLVKIVYGPQYTNAILPLRILLIGYIFSSIYLPLSFLYYTIDLPQIRFFLEAGKMCIVVILLVQLTPLWDLIGTAISMSIAMASNALFSGVLIILLLRNRKLHSRHQFVPADTVGNKP
ncbi:oligosaccharide flippase family protein [Desulfosarcina ovata]|uniref:oligosaccharide flippase family protein n=1 Tax=Desulfosarcina ovata TaxID=83564 RepID=UPI0012D2B0D8|nr:oligosaccharide flippase family protein [Desulfosarcina ovata]